MEHQAYLLLGSNLGNRHAYLQHALRDIQSQCGPVFIRSAVYESEPWGFDSELSFLNQAVGIHTELSAPALLDTLLKIEKSYGRHRNGNGGYESRSIDIDIMYYDKQIINSSQLRIPHPRLHLRRFVLVPLNEIAPAFTHPVLKKTNRELLLRTNDNSRVKSLQMIA